jgi:hypothetical protein
MVVDSLAESIADVIRPMAEDRDLMRAFHVVVEDWHGGLKTIGCGLCLYFFPRSSFSRMRGFSNSKAPWIGSNGKVGTRTSECTIIVRA